MKKTIINFFVLLFFFLLVFFVQILGTLATDETRNTWYRMLNLPTWTPPNWVFAPIWTILYISIALSGYLFWKKPKGKIRTYALSFWGAQLVLNTLWSFAFFYFMMPALGAIDIVLTILAVIGTIYYGRKISSFGAYLLIPYLVWLIYAASLNWAIVFMN